MVLTIRKRGSWGLAALRLVLRTPGLHLVVPSDTTLAEVRNECSFANGAELTNGAHPGLGVLNTFYRCLPARVNTTANTSYGKL